MLLQALAEISPEADSLKSVEGVRDVQDFIGKYQSRFGAALLKCWKLGQVFVDAAMYAEHPDKAPAFTKELLVVHLGHRLSRYKDAPSFRNDLEQDPASRFLDLQGPDLEQIHDATFKVVAA